MNPLIIGTRGSALALKQAHWVAERVAALSPDMNITIETIKTTGDIARDAPLSQIGGKGLFTKEIELALLEHRVDLAVHSLKDLPTDLPENLVIASVPDRASPYDALICARWSGLEALPDGATVGTSSPRRAAQILAHRPDLRVAPLRGNIDTRLNRVTEGTVDAAVMACAGLERLGRSDAITQVLPMDLMVPAVGQGAIAVEIRKNEASLARLLNRITDAYAEAEVSAERALLAALGGGCQVPIGALARAQGDGLTLTGCVCCMDGTASVRTTLDGTRAQAADLGRRAAQALLEQGAGELLAATP